IACESRYFAYNQQAGGWKLRQQRARPFRLCGTDEKHLATPCLGGFRDMPHLKRASRDHLAFDYALQCAFEGIGVKDTNHNGDAGVPEGFWGPLDELGEVVKEERFHLVLTHLRA